MHVQMSLTMEKIGAARVIRRRGVTDTSRLAFRFRIDPDPDGDPLRPRWRARHAHRHGLTEFRIRVDYERCTVRLGPLGFEFRLAGTEMSRVLPSEVEDRTAQGDAGPYRKQPAGTWTVLRAILPGGDECFLLGLSERSGHGEIVLHRPEYELALAGILACGLGREAFPWLPDRRQRKHPRAERNSAGPLAIDRFGGSEDVFGQRSRTPNGVSAAAGATPGSGTRPGSGEAAPSGLVRPSARWFLPGRMAIGRAGEWLPDLDDEFELI